MIVTLGKYIAGRLIGSTVSKLIEPGGYWYAVSSYGFSPARQKNLIQVHSRRFYKERDAKDWKDFCEEEEEKKSPNRRKTFALVYVEKGSQLEKLF